MGQCSGSLGRGVGREKPRAPDAEQQYLEQHFEGHLFRRSADTAAGCVLMYYHSNRLCFNSL